MKAPLLMKNLKTVLSLYFVCLVILSSCSQRDFYENLEAEIAVNEKIHVEYEDVKIHIDTVTYPFYSIFQNVIINDSSYLAGYNRKMHSIDIINLSSRQFIKHIKLDKRGPNGIEDVYGFYMHNWDTIFISNHRSLVIIDSTNQIKATYDPNTLANNRKAGLSLDLGFDLIFSPTRNSVFYKYVMLNADYRKPGPYSKPFVAEYNLDNRELSLIHIEYSNYIKSNYLGWLSIPYITLVEDKFYCCFTGESNIYSFDLNKNNSAVYGGRSNYTKNLAKPISPTSGLDEKTKHIIENVAFFNLRYDPYREIFYRLHYGDIRYKTSNTINATFYDKSLYLMIFNRNIELLREIKLDDYTFYPEFFGTSQDGIFLNANHELNDEICSDSANFKLLKISYEDN